MRILLLSATLGLSATLATTALTCVAALADGAAGNKLLAQTGSSTATITQSGKNGGTTTTTRSTDGSQTVRRESGNSSATITQSPAGSASVRQDSGHTTAVVSPNVPIPTSREKAEASLSCAEPTDTRAGSKAGMAPKSGTEKTVKSTAASGASTAKPDCFEAPSTAADATTTPRHDTQPRREAEVTTRHDGRRTPVEQDIKAKFGFDLEPSPAFKNNFLKKVP